MTLQEFYAGIDGNYDEALKRLMSEKFMLRFLGKFADGGDFSAMNGSHPGRELGGRVPPFPQPEGGLPESGTGQAGPHLQCHLRRRPGRRSHGGSDPMARQAEEDYALVMAGIRELQAAQG